MVRMHRVPEIDIRNMSKNIKDRHIFCILNHSFLSNAIMGIVGKNGVGKTTLMKLLCGLMVPDEGEILIRGMRIGARRKELMYQLGVFLTEVRTVHWGLTIWQNLLYSASLKGVFGAEALAQANKIVGAFSLVDQKDRKLGTLSFGTRQKTSLACALVHAPSILLLDEPTLGLDQESILILQEILLERRRKKCLTVIATNELEFLRPICDQVLEIKNFKLNAV